jgi:hypothetical protein
MQKNIKMKNSDAIKILETILTSMRQKPNQFNFNYTVTAVGAVGVGRSGGHGIVAIANGPGSVGFTASASAPTQYQIQAAEQYANKEMNAQFSKIQTVLESILGELKANTLDKMKSDSFLSQLKDTWLPNVLSSVISTVLFGLFDS